MPLIDGMRQTLKTRTTFKQKRSPPDKNLIRENSSPYESTQDENLSKSSAAHKTLRPEDIVKKYENFKVNSLKLSVYKDVTLKIFQSINIIK